jgi:hypothetical protein
MRVGRNQHQPCVLPHSLKAVFDLDQRTAMTDSDRRPRDGTYLGDAMPTDSATFRVFSTAVTFALAFVLSLILFAAAVGYHLN